MNELLFGNNKEKEALENILALNQIKKCDNEIDKYKKEIDDLKSEISTILSNEKIEEDFLNKIEKYNNLLSKFDGDSERICEVNSIIEENNVRINDYQARINIIEEKLENLKQEIFDTNDPSRVIECQNEIENNNVKLNELNDILNKLISDNTPLIIEKEYLCTKKNDFDINVPNYDKKEIEKDLKNITEKFNSTISKLSLPVRENIEFCQKKIKNRELEIEKNTDRKNNVISNFPDSIKIDIQEAYNDIEPLLIELDIKQNKEESTNNNNIFDDINLEQKEIDKTKEPKTITIEEKPIEEEKEEESIDIKDEIATLNVEKIEDNIFEKENESMISNNEEPINEKEKNEIEVPKEEKEEVSSVTYVLSEGESFENIAEKVYPSKDNWTAIYYFNKDIVDNYLLANGISNDFDTIKQLANDTSLFTGIQLEIPTDYNFKR